MTRPVFTLALATLGLLSAFIVYQVLAGGRTVAEPALSETQPQASVVLAPLEGAPSPFALRLPVDCQPGEDCWITRYVDRDPTEGISDYQCGSQTYDGHKGTDIDLRDLEAMREGVAVLAAADGIVAGSRDGMQDIDFTKIGREVIAGRECGNGVVLQHADGWQTQYCHMFKGSVRVTKGDRVRVGQQLGLVGMSGLAQTPHLHLSVRHKGEHIDPFDGSLMSQNCSEAAAPLWRAGDRGDMGYRPFELTSIGFSTVRPDYEAATEGLYNAASGSPRAPAIFVWSLMYWLKPGDVLSIQLQDPSGETVLDYSKALENPFKARSFYFAGLKKPDIFWLEGTYTGTVRIERMIDGELFAQQRTERLSIR